MVANPPHRAFSSTANPIAVYLLYALYVLNAYVIRSKRFEKRVWDLLKVELFYIGGHCQHSGNCCKGIMLFHEDQPITHVELFKTLRHQDNDTYHRFTPTLSEDDSTRIQCFDCSDLDATNRCSRYDKRPTFCRRYPLSSFLMADRLMPDCGYKIFRTQVKIPGKHPQLMQRIQSIGFFSLFLLKLWYT